MDDFNKSIKQSIELFDKLSFLLQSGPMNSLSVSEETKRASYRSKSYRELYDTIVSFQDFNVLLPDGALFQFTKLGKGINSRLAFYPNPYKFISFQDEKQAALELLDAGEIELDEYEQLLSESDCYTEIPLIRYDVDESAHCEFFHPTAHFHIGFFSENRWPVRRLLTPLAFTFKILLHYYPELWRKHNKQFSLDLDYRNELKNCLMLDNIDKALFMPIESERLHFS